MADNFSLAALMFPDISSTPDKLLEAYPPRALKEGALVTRFAPSPTGFLHIGNVFTAMVAERAARASGGTYILRIEDTDKKREVEGGVQLLIQSLAGFGIVFDEGPMDGGGERGDYGPYTQSGRRALYHTFCRALVEKGLAYPCFCTEEALAGSRAAQEEQGMTPGYWGEHAVCRRFSPDEAERHIKSGMPYVVRMRSPGKPGGRVKFRDVIRGDIEMEENFLDVVLLKKDGLPTYHFAHVVDDTLMRVNQVIRGDEWIASAPIHLQMLWMCGLKPLKYAHVSPIMKEEDGSRRKLSKRKDPEAAATYFEQQGYPSDAVIEYLLSIANSNYEDWRKQNREASWASFPFSLGKMSASGALFDIVKLQSVSGDVIARMTARQVTEHACRWAQTYDASLYGRLSADLAFTQGIFAIDRGGSKPRKDITRWGDVGDYCDYFFSSAFDTSGLTAQYGADVCRDVLSAYLDIYNPADGKDEWFAAIKNICGPLGFCPDVKQYKAEPDKHKGHVGDISAIIRFAVTGRKNTPDLHAIMALLGENECRGRMERCIASLR